MTKAQKLAGLWPQLQEQIQNRQAESWGQQVEQWAADTRRMTKKSVATN